MGEGKTSSAGLKQPPSGRAGLVHKNERVKIFTSSIVHANVYVLNFHHSYYTVRISRFLFSRFCPESRKWRKCGPRKNFPLYAMASNYHTKKVYTDKIKVQTRQTVLTLINKETHTIRSRADYDSCHFKGRS